MLNKVRLITIQDGFSALHVAAREGLCNIVEILVEYGIQVDILSSVRLSSSL